jgi:hypothetical protein
MAGRTEELNYIYLGTFDQTSDKILVSDPCYELEKDEDTFKINFILNNAQQGKWNTWVIIDRENGRNAELIAISDTMSIDCKTLDSNFWSNMHEMAICVDSGQAGIYDAAHFKDDNDNDKWYDMNCKITISHEHCAGIIPYGIVSKSGYGDGIYDLFVSKKNKKIVGVRIVFIDEKQKKKYEKIFEQCSSSSNESASDE